MEPPSDQPRSAQSAQSPSVSEALSEAVIGAAIRVHRRLGPGLLESVYEACLTYELTRLDIPVRTQVPLPIIYDSVHLDAGYRLDIIADEQLVIELKCVDRLDRVHLAQMMTYLRLSGRRVGLLMNFNVAKLTDGLRRVVNCYSSRAQS
jgi:GxxExxY protein